MRQLTEDVLLLKSLHQSALILIGNKVATLGIVTDLECVYHVRHGSLVTHHVPEVLLVLVSGTGTAIGRSSCRAGCHRLAGDRSVDGLGQFCLDFLTALHTLDFIGEGGKFLLHAVVGGIILCGEDTLVGTMGFQETIHSSQKLGALIAHFDNSHNEYLQIKCSF